MVASAESWRARLARVAGAPSRVAARSSNCSGERATRASAAARRTNASADVSWLLESAHLASVTHDEMLTARLVRSHSREADAALHAAGRLVRRTERESKPEPPQQISPRLDSTRPSASAADTPPVWRGSPSVARRKLDMKD